MDADYKAVPRLLTPDPVPGAGSEHSAQAWAERIALLRPSLAKLSPRTLCNLCREACIGDLLGLVISTPFSQPTLDLLHNGLTDACWQMVQADAAQYGNSLLAADLAAGTWQRLSELLAAAEAKCATAAQMSELHTLGVQFAALADPAFDHALSQLESIYLTAFIHQQGGLDSALGQRLRSRFSAKTWDWLSRDITRTVAEPLSRQDAALALAHLPGVFAGGHWPEDDATTPEEMDALLTETEPMLASLSEPKD